MSDTVIIAIKIDNEIHGWELETLEVDAKYGHDQVYLASIGSKTYSTGDITLTFTGRDWRRLGEADWVAQESLRRALDRDPGPTRSELKDLLSKVGHRVVKTSTTHHFTGQHPRPWSFCTQSPCFKDRKTLEMIDRALRP